MKSEWNKMKGIWNESQMELFNIIILSFYAGLILIIATLPLRDIL